MERVCGYMVVRKPEHATAALYEPNLRIGEMTYRGIDRLPWEDLEVAFYEGNPPTPMLPVWDELKQQGGDLSGLELLKSYSDALDVWRHWRGVSDILALWSPELEEIKGCINCDIDLTYIGLDCICLGEWSVLLNGAYVHPEHFKRTVGRLNKHGLLSYDTDCSELFDRYLELAREEIVEPLSDGATATNIRVFAVSPAEAISPRN